MYIESLENDDYSDKDDGTFLGKFRNSFLEISTYQLHKHKQKQKQIGAATDFKQGCRQLLTFYLQQKTPLPELIYALKINRKPRSSHEVVDLTITPNKKFYCQLVSEEVLMNLGIDINYQYQLDQNTSQQTFDFILEEILQQLVERQWLQMLSQPKVIQAVLEMTLEYIAFMKERVQVILQDPCVIEFIDQLRLLLDEKERKKVVCNDVIKETYQILIKLMDCMRDPEIFEQQKNDLYKVKSEHIHQRKKRKQNREYKYSLEINFWKQRSKIPAYYIYVNKIAMPEIIYSIKIDRPERKNFPNKIKLRLYTTEKTIEALYNQSTTKDFMESFYMKDVVPNQTLKYLDRIKAKRYFDDERVDDIYATNLINGCIDSIYEQAQKDVDIMDRLHDCITSPCGGFLIVKLHHLLKQEDLSPRDIVEDLTQRIDKLKELLKGYKRSVPLPINPDEYIPELKME
ncbi:unnamed protein product [Paramecium pentaurelia]|uniref:Uncharacterized protein n=1 Tax=Paramecium pentaurelia TaxID=43138 RepID=A0A8S1U3Z7_9CILI|nr:unnamed protein product [Paramecium pentaurelia]